MCLPRSMALKPRGAKLLKSRARWRRKKVTSRNSLRRFDGRCFLALCWQGLQQISGITPLFSFLPDIFRAAGIATSDAFFQSVLVSLVNLLFTLVALWLVDRAGRKTLILAGTSCNSFPLRWSAGFITFTAAVWPF